MFSKRLQYLANVIFFRSIIIIPQTKNEQLINASEMKDDIHKHKWHDGIKKLWWKQHNSPSSLVWHKEIFLVFFAIAFYQVSTVVVFSEMKLSKNNERTGSLKTLTLTAKITTTELLLQRKIILCTCTYLYFKWAFKRNEKKHQSITTLY